MKAVIAPRRDDNVLLVQVDPLRLATGPRLLPRGGAHGTARRPSRARSKRELARQMGEHG
jgi:hypothetical protein